MDPKCYRSYYDDQGQIDPTIQIIEQIQVMIARNRRHTHPVGDDDAVSIGLLASDG